MSSCTVRPSVSYFDFSGQTAGPIRLKFGSNVPLLTGKQGLQSSFRSRDFKYVQMADLVTFFKNLLQIHQSECPQIWVTTLGQSCDVKLQRSCRSRDRKCFKMAFAQIPSKIFFSRPTSQNATKFGFQHYDRVLMLNCRGHANRMTGSMSI